MLLKDYWFRELYLSLKVTASLSESLMDRFDGITPDFKNQDLCGVERPICGYFRPCMGFPLYTTAYAEKASKARTQEA